jgi:hypothetical protein
METDMKRYTFFDIGPLTGRQMIAAWLIGLALIAVGLVIDAHAATPIPRDVRGNWCSGSTNNDSDSYLACNEGEGGGEFVVEANGYSGLEYGCRAVEVKTWFDPRIIRNTKEWGVSVSRVTAQCESGEGRGSKWREETTMYVSKGVLVAKTRQLTKPR